MTKLEAAEQLAEYVDIVCTIEEAFPLEPSWATVLRAKWQAYKAATDEPCRNSE